MYYLLLSTVLHVAYIEHGKTAKQRQMEQQSKLIALANENNRLKSVIVKMKEDSENKEKVISSQAKTIDSLRSALASSNNATSQIGSILAQQHQHHPS